MNEKIKHLFKINLAVRLKNGTFLISLATALVSLIYTVLALFTIVPSFSHSAVIDSITALIQVLIVLGIVTDPTTSGVTDSGQVLSYTEPNKE